MIIKEMSLVSIIVPIYNVEQYLDHCVQTIVNQTYKNLEIILVDDGSPDHCPAMCDAWAEKDMRVKVIHKPNGGVSDARNKGLSIATGEYICFIDADDYISPLLVERLYQNGLHDGIAVCNFRNVYSDDTTDRFTKPEKTFTIPFRSIKDITKSRGGLFCWGILFPREIIFQEPEILFDTQLVNLEDAIWMGTVLTRVKQITFVDWGNPMYYYLVREGAVTQKSADTHWQATSWVKAGQSVKKRYSQPGPHMDGQQKHILKQMSRHCLNNYYGECFAGGMGLSEIKTLGARPIAEILLYKAAFRMRGVLKRR